MSNQNLEMALDTLKFLHPDGGVFEICIIAPLAPTSPNWTGKAFGKKPIVAGWFRNQEKAANLATGNEAEGIYTTLNPCQDALLGRADHRLKAGVNRTKDTEIEQLQNLLIDLDPIRPEGISSTDLEHHAALEMAQIIRADLTKEGWPDPLTGDSGNGGHLIYPLDLPNNLESIALVKAVLEALAQQYADELKRRNLVIDQAVFNPARLTKLYGTMVHKGDDTSDRPHRLSKIISLPEARQPVPLEFLKKLAATVSNPEQTQTTISLSSEPRTGRIDVEAYLKRYGIELMKVKPYAGGMLYCLRTCIFDSSSSDNEAAIFQAADGALSYQCFHNSCKGRTWAEARAKISGHNKLTEFIIGTVNSRSTQDELKKQNAANHKSSVAPLDKTQWGFAPRLFPRIAFPWVILPPGIADSLKQLGSACATSPQALPGALFAIVGSVLGRTLAVSPKASWKSPLNFWHIDIRISGEGKTAPARLIARPVREAQRKAEERYQQEMDYYESLTRRNKRSRRNRNQPEGIL